VESDTVEHTAEITFAAGQAAKGAVKRIAAYPELAEYTLGDIKNAWGLACSFDIYDCNPETIRDADKIKQFVRELCHLIAMRRYGETTVVNFGEDERVAGFSMVQLIETSLISAHFANLTNAVYLDVFSCKPYDPAIVEEFATAYFGGSRCITQVSLRK
jgi:S-adenosylmethionine/arginine decarboxylase-like enzyme